MEYGHCSGSATKLKQTRTPKGVGIAVLALGYCAVVTLPAGQVSAQVRIDDGAARPAPPPAEAAPVQPKPAEPVLVKPKPIDVQVLYPEDGEGKGTVVLEILVGIDGKVGEAQALEGEAPFTQAALEATQHWRFEPATRDGEPFAARLRFAVEFTPPEPAPEPAEAVTPRPGALNSAPQAARTGDPSTAKPQAAASEDEAVDVLVTGERPEAGQSFSQAEIRELPGAFGDPFRAIEAMPGVVPIVSGLPYFYVRGAPPGNVGYYFDGIRVPVLYHFAAGPAILHPAFVGQVDLYPGAYPSRYGRYAGAIVSGEMQPAEHQWRGEASVRLIDSGAMLEAPFADRRGSVMAGGRISYTGLLLSLIVPEVTVTYWDYQTRTHYEIDEDDSVEVLLFGSGDFVSEDEFNPETGRSESQTVVDIGFHRLDTRWDRQIDGGRWRNALMLGLDRTALDDDVELSSYLLGYRSELDRELSPTRRLRAGIDVLFESLGQNFEDNQDEVGVSAPMTGMFPADGEPMVEAPITDPTRPAPQVGPAVDGMAAVPVEPGMFTQEPMFEDEPEPGDEDFDLGFGDRIDFVGGAYADVVMDVTPRVEFTPGLRFDVFVSRGDVALGIDPRVRARYKLNADWTLVHALGLAHQMPSFPIPIPGIAPSLKGGLQRALQHSAGAEVQLGNDFSSTFSVFNNIFFNMTDLIGVPGAEDNGFRSLGHAYGFEAMVRRDLSRKVGGFVSYTLSRSDRFLGRYQGPSTTDRTHVVNLALSYDLGRHWRFGNRLLFYTGMPAQLGGQQPDTSRRVPAFWRLDWRLQKRWPTASGGHWGLIFEVLNTTLNKEIVSLDCNDDGCDEESIGPVTIPSIGVEAKF